MSKERAAAGEREWEEGAAFEKENIRVNHRNRTFVRVQPTGTLHYGLLVLPDTQTSDVHT